MIFFNTPEFKVGVLVTVITGLIAGMSMTVTENSGFTGRSKRHSFVLNDANGLIQNGAVKMAGIKVGIIDDIVLEGGKARIKIIIDKDVPLRVSSLAVIQPDGLLGHKHVELMPGNSLDPPLPPGTEILSASEKGSINKVLTEMDGAIQSLQVLSETLSKVIGEGADELVMGRVFLNLEHLTKGLSDIVNVNEAKITEAIDQMYQITSTIDSLVNDNSMEGLKGSWQQVVDSLRYVSTSLQNIEEITEKVNQGGGTIGRLINDGETVNELNTTIRNVNDLVGGVAKWETSIDFHSEYLSQMGDTKSFLSIKVQPGLDRYYELGVVDDPRGVVKLSSTTTAVDNQTSSTFEETKTFYNKVKIHALFAKNFYDFTIKGGILANSAGLGFDYHLWRRSLRLSLEAFEFNDLYVRAYARYNILKSIYLIGGIDNLLGEVDEKDVFIGAGIFITNDDLKMLASKVAL